MPLSLTRAAFLSLGGATLGAGLFACPAAAASDQLTVMQSEQPRSMDPADQTAVFTASVLAPMYEGLTQWDSQLAVRPCLAVSWTSDALLKEWTFALRPGVAFHDGTPCDAEAVVASFQRHLDIKRGLASSGRFRGIIASVAAKDAATVGFTLKAPYPSFPRLLANVSAAIISPAGDKAGALGRHAIGTGPFRFVEWSSGEYVQQERNPRYWGAAPAMAGLKWTWSSEAAVMNMAVRTGDATIVNPLPPAFFAQMKTQTSVRVMESDGSAVYWLALNSRLKPLDDVRVRQALNYATDRQALVKSLLYGHATAAASPLAPVDLYYDPSVPGYPYDIARAKSLLAAAGYADGFSMNVAVQEANASIAEALQGMWANAGVKLDVSRMESGVWVQAAFGDPDKKAAQKIFSTLASWSTGFIDPDLQLRPLYGTSNWSPGGPNLGFYSNPDLDQILERAASTAEADQRRMLYAHAQHIVSDQAPHVLLHVPKDLTAVAANVQGIWLVPGGQVMVAGARRA